jgi:hypothetical protein
VVINTLIHMFFPRFFLVKVPSYSECLKYIETLAQPTFFPHVSVANSHLQPVHHVMYNNYIFTIPVVQRWPPLLHISDIKP